MTRRWPLHPPPGEGEALTSWLNRLAEVYGMSVEDLLRHNLAAPGANLPDQQTLDLDPPPWLLPALAERTGISLDRLRQLTIAGWVPWLLDSLDPEPVPGACRLEAAFGGLDSAMFLHDFAARLGVTYRGPMAPPSPT